MDRGQRHVKGPILIGIILLFLCTGTSLAEPSTKEQPVEEIKESPTQSAETPEALDEGKNTNGA